MNLYLISKITKLDISYQWSNLLKVSEYSKMFNVTVTHELIVQNVMERREEWILNRISSLTIFFRFRQISFNCINLNLLQRTQRWSKKPIDRRIIYDYLWSKEPPTIQFIWNRYLPNITVKNPMKSPMKV